MTELNLPHFDFRLRSDNDTTYIFDPIRKKELVLTPEEWVRQHIIQTLIQRFDYPASLLHLEKGLVYNQRNKRYDVLFYNRDGKPYLLIECKAPKVNLTKETLIQAHTYNHEIKAQYILLTNGLKHLCFASQNGQLEQLSDFPSFQ